MLHPVSIALRLRAILLTGLLLWLLAVPHLVAAAPRATVVRTTGPHVEHQARPVSSEALRFALFSIDDRTPYGLSLPGAALLPVGPEYRLRENSPAQAGGTRSLLLLPELPAQRAWLRSSVSPNAP